MNFFFNFLLHFPENRGGSDPSITNVTLFFLKASIKDVSSVSLSDKVESL